MSVPLDTRGIGQSYSRLKMASFFSNVICKMSTRYNIPDLVNLGNNVS